MSARPRRGLARQRAGLDAGGRARPALTAEERHRVIVEWNKTATDYEPKLIQALVEAQARERPDAVAVEFEDGQLSYAELDAAANRLAHHLQQLDVTAGCLVGICLERSIDLVVAVVGTLKSGGAYVPLDPTYPRHRVEAMLSDAGPSVVLTDEALARDLPEHPGLTLRLDSERSRTASCPETPPHAPITPADLAYVIYTSGSTGAPKGVVVPHEGIANLAEVCAREFQTGPGTRVLQFANFSFDAWMAELAQSLAVGGTLVLAPREQLANTDALHSVLSAARIEVVTLPPTVLAVLDVDGLSSLRTICSAGEACSWELLERWARPGRRFINGYGPTEITVAGSYYQAGGQERRRDATTVPIGGPLANKRAYVVDAELQPVGVGQPGELVVGGVGIARGYLGRPELTAEKFIRDPFSSDTAARAYRTGDLVRWLPDGVLEFLGRVDDQVKIRGFRIEPGEVESLLRARPDVMDAVVVTREYQPARPRLVAYAVSDTHSSELLAHLRHRLPEWMVPSSLMTLDALPMTANGKVDRGALPAPTRAGGEYVGPRTPVEQTVTSIFGEVLGIDAVGIDDAFFELGGDSLLATRVGARLRSVLKTQIPVEALFEAPTAREFSEAILLCLAGEQADQLAARLSGLSAEKRTVLEHRMLDSARHAGAEERIPRRAPGDPAPLSFAQQRLWFLDQLRPGEHTYNAALPMLIHGPVDAEALQRALDAVVERHEVMRTVYRGGPDGAPTQVVLPDAHVELSVLDLRELPPPDRRDTAIRALREHGRRPFDLAHDVTTRAVLARIGDDEHALMVVSHHICCDGWSRDILFHDLAAFYEGFLDGTTAELPELPVQYRDYALWQRRWLTDDELERLLSYWRGALEGVPPVLEMPTDKARPPALGFSGAFRWFSVPADLTGSLIELGRSERATMYQTLLTAFNALVFARSGQTDFLVGSPIANRQQIEVDALIGFFSNTLVVRADVDGDPSFRTLVRRVRRTTLGGYAHQDTPFEKIVEALRPPRDPSRNPLFQTNFRVQAVPPPRLELAGAEVEPLELDLATSRFDFAMDLHAEVNGSLRGYLEYNTDLFESSTVSKLVDDYLAILGDVAQAPDVPLGQLDSVERIAGARGDRRPSLAK